MAGGFLFLPGDSERIDSLAVLPFENGSADPEAEYFSDGVTESIISSLSKLPDVRVISRTSVFRYKGQTIDPGTVGRELGVDSLVLGRVVQRGDDLTVSAELVRTDDSGQIWGEQYQRKAADIFSIQNDMAREIGDALRIQLTTEQEELLTKQYTESSDAYEAYLKGRYHWNKRTEKGIRQAIVHFQEAINHDSNYALAYTGLADSFSLLGYYYVSPREVFPRAKQAAERALELDGSLGEAHVSLGWIKCIYDWDLDEAEREFVRGIELNPTYATGHQWYSVYLAVTGRYGEAIERNRMALELEPLSRIINHNYGRRLSDAGRYEEAHEPTQENAGAGLGLGARSPRFRGKLRAPRLVLRSRCSLRAGRDARRLAIPDRAARTGLCQIRTRRRSTQRARAYGRAGRDAIRLAARQSGRLRGPRRPGHVLRSGWSARTMSARATCRWCAIFRGSRMSNETRDSPSCCAASDSKNRAVILETLSSD